MLEVHSPAHDAMTGGGGDIASSAPPPPRNNVPEVVHANAPPQDAGNPTTIDEATTGNMANDGVGPLDPLSLRLRNEALEAEMDEPELSILLRSTVLAPPVRTFEDAVACTVAYRLLGRPPACDKMIADHLAAGGERPMFCPNALQRIVSSALSNPNETELGHTMSEAVRLDALAVLDRDPACETLLEVVLFYKGFAALVAHRAARQRWNPAKRSITALWLQSQASSQFGLDIHPAASIGAGVMFDHGTGVVIGETAVVGDGCTLLHGVTLGGTGKERGDRHPKVGAHVLIGAGASILGNITVGSGAKIGAGSIVLRPIPSGATAVGAPAKIVGRVVESDPASTVDETLRGVSPLHVHHKSKKKQSSKPSSPDAAAATATAAEDVVKMNRINSSVTSSTATLSLLTEPETDLDDDANSDDSTSSQQRRDENDCCCPFRDLKRLGQREAPSHPGCITFCMLYKLLAPAGANYAQVGEVYFAMDEDLLGYIPLEYFREHCIECIERYTNLNEVGKIVGPFIQEQERKVREISSSS